MPFVMAFDALEAIDVDHMPDLDVSESADEYDAGQAYGCWIVSFLCTLAEVIRRDFNVSGFRTDFGIGDRMLQRISSPAVRAAIIGFVNEHYQEWVDDHVVPYSEDAATDDVKRSLCEGCEDGWEKKYAEYDGPMAGDVEPDEELVLARTDKERLAMLHRNLTRQMERDKRLRDQRAAEAVVLSREFVCDDRCGRFFEALSDALTHNTVIDTEALIRMWDEHFHGNRPQGMLPGLHAPPLVVPRRDETFAFRNLAL